MAALERRSHAQPHNRLLILRLTSAHADVYIVADSDGEQRALKIHRYGRVEPPAPPGPPTPRTASPYERSW